MPLLKVTDASGRQTQHQLNPQQICLIGRAPDNQIVLDDPRASRHHAHIKPADDGSFMIVDGVYVNSQLNRSANKVYIVETKGREDLDVPLKMARLKQWCEDVNAAQSNVVFTDKTPQEIVRIIEARGHDEAVIIGGTQTVSEFAKAGLVDELHLVVEPVLFGGGLPLLRDVDADFKMTLVDVQKLSAQTVQLHYRMVQSR